MESVLLCKKKLPPSPPRIQPLMGKETIHSQRDGPKHRIVDQKKSRAETLIPRNILFFIRGAHMPNRYPVTHFMAATAAAAAGRGGGGGAVAGEAAGAGRRGSRRRRRRWWWGWGGVGHFLVISGPSDEPNAVAHEWGFAMTVRHPPPRLTVPWEHCTCCTMASGLVPACFRKAPPKRVKLSETVSFARMLCLNTA